MGVFLAMSGVIGAGRDRVERALTALAADGTAPAPRGDADEPAITVIAEKGPNVTVLYPSQFGRWDAISRRLSSTLAAPVFSLHVHDGDIWMFVLFCKGVEVTRFNPIPHYWDWGLPPAERDSWRGNAQAVARAVPHLDASAVEAYLQPWSDELLEEGPPKRAYPDDRYTVGDCWQIADFMRRVGLKFPIDNDGTINGRTYNLWARQVRLDVGDRPASRRGRPGRSWWRFWRG